MGACGFREKRGEQGFASGATPVQGARAPRRGLDVEVGRAETEGFPKAQSRTGDEPDQESITGAPARGQETEHLVSSGSGRQGRRRAGHDPQEGSVVRLFRRDPTEEPRGGAGLLQRRGAEPFEGGEPAEFRGDALRRVLGGAPPRTRQEPTHPRQVDPASLPRESAVRHGRRRRGQKRIRVGCARAGRFDRADLGSDSDTVLLPAAGRRL